jgi:phospholipid-binding lipoprotein MlaA
MKIRAILIPALLAALAGGLLTGCATASRKQPAVTVARTGSPEDGKSVKDGKDAVDEYAARPVYDPWEGVNRATFWFNDRLYAFVIRPVSWTYDTVVPKPLRQGVFNVYENAHFPVRFVNDTLQGNFQRAGQETGKFVVNSVAGVGGLMRVSDRIPALADVPTADTGQTFAKWGIGAGPYFVIPVLGPSTVRDAVGVAGDYALNPVTWVTIIWGGQLWTLAVSTPDAVRVLHDRLALYDTMTKNAVDPYLASRAAYLQYRKQKESQ